MKIFLAGLFLAAMIADASAACQIDRIEYCEGCRVERKILVDPGGVCGISRSAPGALLGIDVLESPKLGTLVNSSRAMLVYRAGQKAGTDRFAYRIRYEWGGRNMEATIVNHVTIGR